MVLIKSYKCKRDRRRKSKVKKWSRPRKVCIIRKNFFDGCSNNISNNNSYNFTVLPTRQTLTYAEAQKFVDVLTDGHVHRLDILDRLVIEDSTNTIKTIESHFCFENNEMSPPIACVKTCSVKEIDYPISNTSDANCKKPNSFGLPVFYIRSFDLLPDDLDTEVEYDVDEEDIHWLKLLNEHRKSQKQSTLSVDMLECILDKLEKESHIITMSSPFIPSSTTLNDHNNVKKYSSSRNLNTSFNNKNTTDNNITSNSNCSDASRSNDVSKDGKLKVQKCGVCRESQTSPTNAMIVCNGCSLTVHQDCYGVPYYPDGEWLCKKCLKSPNTPVKCVLCPCSWRSQGGGPGAMKQTDDGRWVHILCALFIPEVTFGSNVYLEPVEKIEKVPRWRSEMRCWGCNRTGRGACLCCQAPQCCRSFHALCAIKKGCYLKIFNSSLSSASADVSGTNSVNSFSSNKTTKRIGDRRNRLFYCHRHKHLAYEDKQLNADYSEKKSSFNNLSLHSYLASSSTAFSSRVNGSARPKKISSSLTRLKNNSRGRKELLHTRRQRQRRPLNHRQPQYISENKLGKKPAKKRCRSKMAGDVNQLTHLSMPIEIPDIPQHRLEALSTSLPVRDKEFLMACIHRYWLLKRHSRDGLPLIQRLQQILLIHQTIKIQLESSSRSTTTTTATTRIPSSMLSASSSSTAAAATMMMSLDENSLKLLRRWRQDYEKVRLLLELIRKREKMKFELIKLKEHMLELQLEPFNVLLKHTLEQLMMKDAIGLFAYPVTDEEAPGYSDIISRPMDYWTMGEKINNHQYSNFDEFESDFQLIIDNCTLYNGAGSVLDNIGIRHKKQCAIILESARRMCNRAGYCPISGVHVTMETEGNDNGECKLEVDSSRTGDTSLNDTVLYSLNGDGDEELLNDSDVKSNHIHHHHRRYLRTFVNRCKIDEKNNRRNICTANYNSVDKKVMNAVNAADDFGSPDVEMTNEKKVLDSRLDELLSRLDALYVIHSKNRLYQIKKTKKEIARLRRRITFIDQQLTNHKTPRSCSSRSKSKSKSASPPVTRNLRSCRALVFQDDADVDHITRGRQSSNNNAVESDNDKVVDNVVDNVGNIDDGVGNEISEDVKRASEKELEIMHCSSSKLSPTPPHRRRCRHRSRRRQRRFPSKSSIPVSASTPLSPTSNSSSSSPSSLLSASLMVVTTLTTKSPPLAATTSSFSVTSLSSSSATNTTTTISKTSLLTTSAAETASLLSTVPPSFSSSTTLTPTLTAATSSSSLVMSLSSTTKMTTITPSLSVMSPSPFSSPITNTTTTTSSPSLQIESKAYHNANIATAYNNVDECSNSEKDSNNTDDITNEKGNLDTFSMDNDEDNNNNNVNSNNINNNNNYNDGADYNDDGWESNGIVENYTRHLRSAHGKLHPPNYYGINYNINNNKRKLASKTNNNNENYHNDDDVDDLSEIKKRFKPSADNKTTSTSTSSSCCQVVTKNNEYKRMTRSSSLQLQQHQQHINTSTVMISTSSSPTTTNMTSALSPSLRISSSTTTTTSSKLITSVSEKLSLATTPTLPVLNTTTLITPSTTLELLASSVPHIHTTPIATLFSQPPTSSKSVLSATTMTSPSKVLLNNAACESLKNLILPQNSKNLLSTSPVVVMKKTIGVSNNRTFNVTSLATAATTSVASTTFTSTTLSTSLMNVMTTSPTQTGVVNLSTATPPPTTTTIAPTPENVSSKQNTFNTSNELSTNFVKCNKDDINKNHFDAPIDNNLNITNYHSIIYNNNSNNNNINNVINNSFMYVNIKDSSSHRNGTLVYNKVDDDDDVTTNKDKSNLNNSRSVYQKFLKNCKVHCDLDLLGLKRSSSVPATSSSSSSNTSFSSTSLASVYRVTSSASTTSSFPLSSSSSLSNITDNDDDEDDDDARTMVMASDSNENSLQNSVSKLAHGNERRRRRRSSQSKSERTSRASSVCSKDGDDLKTFLQAGDVVWAKNKGYPWYPALIVKSDSTPLQDSNGFFQNLTPPPCVMNLASKFTEPVFLVRFFDKKRNWQWLPRNKVHLLGWDPSLDRERLSNIKKSKLRKDIKRAFGIAIHQIKMSGQFHQPVNPTLINFGDSLKYQKCHQPHNGRYFPDLQLDVLDSAQFKEHSSMNKYSSTLRSIVVSDVVSTDNITVTDTTASSYDHGSVNIAVDDSAPNNFDIMGSNSGGGSDAQTSNLVKDCLNPSADTMKRAYHRHFELRDQQMQHTKMTAELNCLSSQQPQQQHHPPRHAHSSEQLSQSYMLQNAATASTTSLQLLSQQHQQLQHSQRGYNQQQIDITKVSNNVDHEVASNLKQNAALSQCFLSL